MVKRHSFTKKQNSDFSRIRMRRRKRVRQLESIRWAKVLIKFVPVETLERLVSPTERITWTVSPVTGAINDNGMLAAYYLSFYE